jgi:hypothetical protein
MKALTLTQPWATFVAHGLKLTETRSWATKHRGWLAIHAAQGFPAWAKELCMQDPFEHWLEILGYTISSLPRGAVIAKVHMIDCVRFGADYDPGAEAPFGDFAEGRYGWIFASVVKFENTIPAKGALSVWEWNEK